MDTIRTRSTTWWCDAGITCVVATLLGAWVGCDGIGRFGSAGQSVAPPDMQQRTVAATTAGEPPVEQDPRAPSTPAAMTDDSSDVPPLSPERLLRPYTEWTLAETAADSLGRIGSAAVPELAALLHDPDPMVRQMSARVLARIGPEAAAAVPQLEALLQDESPQVRRSAARALGQIGPAAARAVPSLMQLLDFDDNDAPRAP